MGWGVFATVKCHRLQTRSVLHFGDVQLLNGRALAPYLEVPLRLQLSLARLLACVRLTDRQSAHSLAQLLPRGWRRACLLRIVEAEIFQQPKLEEFKHVWHLAYINFLLVTDQLLVHLRLVNFNFNPVMCIDPALSGSRVETVTVIGFGQAI